MRPRIIPVLLLDSRRRLIKTRCFGDEVYIGDPFNVVRIFNEKEVDEICILDINASVEHRRPDIGFISELASECFIPLSYGGAVETVVDAARIFAAGVEKVVLGRAGASGKTVRELADSFGSQAISVCVDYRLVDDKPQVVFDRGRRVTNLDPVSYAKAAVDSGAGEIILQSVERDGVRAGYDVEFISSVSTSVSVPIVALGGAGTVLHLVEGLQKGASAVASGSSFVFIGRLRAVLITYPTGREIRSILARENEAS